MSAVSKFIFTDYSFDKSSKTAIFNYATDKGHRFSEQLIFDLDIQENVSRTALDNALKMFWYIAGSSYYKAHLALQIEASELDRWQADQLSHLYLHGLGEFLYVNQLRPDQVAKFTSDKESNTSSEILDQSKGKLLPIGGGKDSLTTVNLLQKQDDKFTTFRINPTKWVLDQLEIIGAPQVTVERIIDPFLTSNKPQLRGHVPVTAIVSAAAVIAAVWGGYDEIIMSNESSADEPTLEDYHGVPINHQYSKSSEAEKMTKQWINRYITPSIKYNSHLRNMTELQIAEVFAKEVFPKFKGRWSSSNSNFRNDAPDKLDWDLTSPKTCTVFALLTPHISRDKLINEFGGNPFVLDENTENWAKLLGKTEAKPFECVATVEEMQVSLELALESGNWPEVNHLI